MTLETNCSTCKHPEGPTPILTVCIPGGLAINILGILVETCPICITVYTACPDPLFLPVEDKATVASGNESPNSCTVTINGTQPSVITCQENFFVNIDPNESVSNVTYRAPLVSDNCPGSNLTCTPESGSFPLGKKNHTSVSTGTSGNTPTCSFKVKSFPGRHSNSDRGKPKPPEHSKHPKSLKPPKHSKHPKPPEHSKHPKLPKPPKHPKHPKLPKSPKPLKHPKPPKPPEHSKHSKPPKPLKHPKPPKPPKSPRKR